MHINQKSSPSSNSTIPDGFTQFLFAGLLVFSWSLLVACSQPMNHTTTAAAQPEVKSPPIEESGPSSTSRSAIDTLPKGRSSAITLPIECAEVLTPQDAKDLAAPGLSLSVSLEGSDPKKFVKCIYDNADPNAPAMKRVELTVTSEMSLEMLRYSGPKYENLHDYWDMEGMCKTEGDTRLIGWEREGMLVTLEGPLSIDCAGVAKVAARINERLG